MPINRRALLKGLAIAPAAIAAIAAGMIVGQQPAAADVAYPTASHFKLKYRTTTKIGTVAQYADVIDDIQLHGSLQRATVDDVLDSANRTGVGVDVQLSGVTQGFMWDPDTNDGSGMWYPQGITTSADYAEVGHYNGRKVILVSWYDHLDDGTGKGARISFVDMTNPDAPEYRHVLLVEPYLDPAMGGAGLPTYRAVNIHAGGITWYGNRLYVVDSSVHKGLRVFDMTKILKVTANGDESTIGLQANGTYAAHNYLYVLPQSAAYDAQAPTGGRTPSAGRSSRSTAAARTASWSASSVSRRTGRSQAALPVAARLHHPAACGVRRRGHRHRGHSDRHQRDAGRRELQRHVLHLPVQGRNHSG